jgi:hypothetical protein
MQPRMFVKGTLGDGSLIRDMRSSETPPAKRGASGSPPEGGVHVGKAPKGLIHNLIPAVFQLFPVREYTVVSVDH